MIKPVIMIVEDNQTTQETLKRDLEALELDILIAPTAKDAWDLLERGTIPDLIVLDFNLPGGEDGPSFFRRLRLDQKFESLPVIPFTALIEQNNTAGQSKVMRFINSRKPESTNNHLMVSKKGREDVYTTPEDLIIEIGRALDNKNRDLPERFRKERRKYLEKRVQKIKTLDNDGG